MCVPYAVVVSKKPHPAKGCLPIKVAYDCKIIISRLYNTLAQIEISESLLKQVNGEILLVIPLLFLCTL